MFLPSGKRARRTTAPKRPAVGSLNGVSDAGEEEGRRARRTLRILTDVVSWQRSARPHPRATEVVKVSDHVLSSSWLRSGSEELLIVLLLLLRSRRRGGVVALLLLLGVRSLLLLLEVRRRSLRPSVVGVRVAVAITIAIRLSVQLRRRTIPLRRLSSKAILRSSCESSPASHRSSAPNRSPSSRRSSPLRLRSPRDLTLLGLDDVQNSILEGELRDRFLRELLTRVRGRGGVILEGKEGGGENCESAAVLVGCRKREETSQRTIAESSGRHDDQLTLLIHLILESQRRGSSRPLLKAQI